MTTVPTLAASPIPLASSKNLPDALPVAFSGNVGLSWTTIIDPPQWDIPEDPTAAVGAGVVVDGVAEILTPLILHNTNSAGVVVEVWVIRASQVTGTMLFKHTLPANSSFPVPVNGQTLYSGDLLQTKASVNNVVTATVSWTIGVPERYEVRT